ncbi:MAG: hypothetical protein J2P45_07795 [Candidatus Dormibacteraeota bacterium]|nr:hypothetical protein [Candidatus Dormibacteraeota bacterium]
MATSTHDAQGRPPEEDLIEGEEERAETLRQLAECEARMPHGQRTAEQERALARLYAEEAEFLRRRRAARGKR